MRRFDLVCSMYYYFFDSYFWHDRVAQADLEWIEPWDLFEMRGVWYGLCLWEKISWTEQYTKYTIATPGEVFLLVKWCLSPFSLTHIHQFVTYRFCSYKKAVGLWIKDPEERVKRMPSEKKWKQILKNRGDRGKGEEHKQITWIENAESVIKYFEERWDGSRLRQCLCVFPDMWTLHQYVSTWIVSKKDVFLAHAKMTKKQQAEGYRGIATWQKRLVISTPSQIFFDWHDIWQIILIDQHKRYYKQPQDPRYHSGTVCEYISQIYDCHFSSTWFTLDERSWVD